MSRSPALLVALCTGFWALQACLMACSPVPMPLDWLTPTQLSQLKRPIILTNVNCKYLSLAENFWMHYSSVNVQSHILFVAEDPIAYEHLKTHYGEAHVVNRPGPALSLAARGETGFGSKEYFEINSGRVSYVRHIVNLGIPVIWLDLDAIFKINPLHVLPGHGWDVIVSQDSPGEDDGWRDSSIGGRTVCACFVVVYPTTQGRQLAAMWEEEMAAGAEHDQKALNNAIAKFRTGNGKGLKLRLLLMPTYLMPSGFDYKDHQETAIWRHVNYITTRPIKIHVLKEESLWLTKSTTFPTCS